MGAIGSTGTTAANALAAEADVVIGIGTRYSDFTTASRTAFQNPDVRFVNINVAPFDAVKHAGLSVVADAREALEALTRGARRATRVDAAYRDRQAELGADWDAQVEAAYTASGGHRRARRGLLTQNQVIGAGQRAVRPARRGGVRGRLDAGRPAQAVAHPRPQGLPRRVRLLLHGLRGRRRHRRHGWPTRTGDVFVMVGDGSYLMMADRAGHRGAGGHQDHRGAGAEPRLRLHRLALGVARLAAVRHRLPLPRRRHRPPGRREAAVDLAANAGSLGADVIEAHRRGARAGDQGRQGRTADGGPIVIHVETDPTVHAPDSDSWWDVPVSQVSDLDSTRRAHDAYTAHKDAQRPYLAPAERTDR